jgi:hypothetical protein
MNMKKTAGQSKPISEVGAKKTPAGRAELRSELVRLIQALEDSDDPRIIKNITEGGFLVLRADELKKIVIALAKILLGE